MEEWIITIKYKYNNTKNNVEGGEFSNDKSSKKLKSLKEVLKEFKQKDDKKKLINEIVMKNTDNHKKYVWNYDKDKTADELLESGIRNFSEVRVN